MLLQLVDSGGEGVVALQRLVQCLQSMEFSRVVATSLALSTIFHGGSYASSNGVAISKSNSNSEGSAQGQEQGQGEEGEQEKKGKDNVTAKASTTGSRLVSESGAVSVSVSVAGTGDIPSLLPVFVDTFSAPAAIATAADDEEEDEQQQEQEKRKPVTNAPIAAPSPDWISKLDFLEFCQAVVDIKRYSVVC